jgi:hypothetical protein
VFPQLKRNRSKQDREAAKNVPVDLARGALSGVLGAPGDIESLIRMLPYLDEKTVLPTSEDIEKKLPFRSDTPVSRAATGLGALGGGFYYGPGSPLKVVGALPKAIKHGAEEFAKASVAGVPHVVKPKGGNWLTGSVEKTLEPLKKNPTASKSLNEMRAVYPPDVLEFMSPETRGTVERAFPHLEKEVALNNWVDRNLGNYVKKEMATPEDPVRNLIDQGISHLPQDALDRGTWLSENMEAIRRSEGFPGAGMANTEAGRGWENLADESIQITAPAVANEEMLKANPWLSKLEPDDSVYRSRARDTEELGFDHIMDVLRQDVESGRIRPEQLNKVSMEQAVRRTYEYDQEMARKMRETALKQQEGFPLHKEYPEGYKWIELAMPKENPKRLSEIDTLLNANRQGGEYGVDWLRGANGEKEYFVTKGSGRNTVYMDKFPTEEEAIARGKELSGQQIDVDALRSEREGLTKEAREKMLEDALKYEGDTMGHCVGGYCPDVLEGRTRIFSLRDAKGEPHVTVEVQPKGAVFSDVAKYIGKEEADRLLDEGVTLSEMIKNIPDFQYPQRIQQIKGKGNAKPKEDYLPYVQDFVKGGKWTEIGDFHHTGLTERGSIFTPDELRGFSDLGQDVPMYLSKEDIAKLRQARGDAPPAEGMKRGGKVSISKNPDAMMLELNNKKMAGGGLAKLIKGAKAVSEAERSLPLVLPRALPKPLSEINAHAERVARQMMGEHVTSGKAGDTRNLAGRSMKESQRVKNLEYEIVPTKDVPESQVVESKIGDINIALPGDFTLSDVDLKSLMGQIINSRQQGGSRYGLGHLKDRTPLFYASNEGPAQGVQNKVTDLAELYNPERVMGHHMAMGPVATNFAQHFADANMRYTDYSKLRPQDMYQFDKIISEGFVTSKKDKKTGETIYKVVDFPDWPGIADPQGALEAMKKNSEMRKWYNKVMQTPKITGALNLPNGQDVRYAITSPDLRDMEVNLTGHGVGEMVPGGALTDTADHDTYAKGIRGIYRGHQEVLTPFPISFADAAQHIMSTQRPQDFTGTIQKVFPHQLVDQQYLDELGAYRRRIKELTGKKKGGAVHKAAGGEINADDLIIEERPL